MAAMALLKDVASCLQGDQTVLGQVTGFLLELECCVSNGLKALIAARGGDFFSGSSLASEFRAVRDTQRRFALPFLALAKRTNLLIAQLIDTWFQGSRMP